MIHLYPRHLCHGPPKFIAIAVLAAKTDRENCADSKRTEVIDNRSRRPGLGANIDNVVHRQTGFDGNFFPGGIDFQVAVQAKITHNRDAEFGILAGDDVETFPIHLGNTRDVINQCGGVSKIRNGRIGARAQ